LIEFNINLTLSHTISRDVKIKMPSEVRETLKKQKPVPMATSSMAGVPNAAFIGAMKILDDETILIADNVFYKTVANLNENPKVSLLCYSGETKKSFQIKGPAEVHMKDKVPGGGNAMLSTRWGES
jgi:predicted pyridoxine 5'-phosphate oxidase superfamily flavin-nucleotide-binding protein